MKIATLSEFIAEALKAKGIEVSQELKSDLNKEKISVLPDKAFVCQRCRDKLKAKNIPPASEWNNLKLDEIPNEHNWLNELEMQLLAM